MGLKFKNSIITLHKPSYKEDQDTFVAIRIQHGSKGLSNRICYIYNVRLDLDHTDAPYRKHFGNDCEKLWLEFLDEHVGKLESSKDLPLTNEDVY